MRTSDLLRILLLAAIWGASFLFLRISAEEFGPFALAYARIAGAALVLLPVLLRPENRAVLSRHKFPLFLQGIFSSALPFTLFSFAALSLEAGFTSLLNAATPISTAIIGFLWLRLPLLRSQVLGLLVGFAGIAILTGDKFSFAKNGHAWSIIAVLAATCSYGVATHYAKLRLADVSPLVVSAGSLLFGALLLTPLAILYWPSAMPSLPAIGGAVALAVVCTAFAFVMFFDVLSRTGATATATVTFVIPVFGILWGTLFLSEKVTGRMLLGMAVALLGTALVTRLLPLRRKRYL